MTKYRMLMTSLFLAAAAATPSWAGGPSCPLLQNISTSLREEDASCYTCNVDNWLGLDANSNRALQKKHFSLDTTPRQAIWAMAKTGQDLSAVSSLKLVSSFTLGDTPHENFIFEALSHIFPNLKRLDLTEVCCSPTDGQREHILKMADYWLQHTQSQDPSTLGLLNAWFRGLEELYLSGTPLHCTPRVFFSTLVNLKNNLKKLHLRHCWWLTRGNQRMENNIITNELVWLRWGTNKTVTRKDLVDRPIFPVLEELDVSDNPCLRDLDIDTFVRIPNLRIINLSRCPGISDDAIAFLKTRRPTLEVIREDS